MQYFKIISNIYAIKPHYIKLSITDSAVERNCTFSKWFGLK